MCVLIIGLLLSVLVGCSGEKPGKDTPLKQQKVAVENVVQPRARQVEFEHERFPTGAQALKAILDRTKPRAVGFGEFHQQHGTFKILSALERFSKDMLPLFAGKTSDIVVETWVASGSCGEVEKEVVTQVEKITERPKTTENETIRLLKRAKGLGIQPHILDVECEDYEKVKDKDGGLDYLELLELVGARLKEKGLKVIANPAPGDSNRMVVIYGGAIHNDAEPDEMWESVSFAKPIRKAALNRYLEVDLYVPEFIQTSNLVRDEPWYPLASRLASKSKALLIKLRKDSYIIVFRKGIKNPGYSLETPAHSMGK
jgi:hypothetical protein